MPEVRECREPGKQGQESLGDAAMPLHDVPNLLHASAKTERVQ